MWNLKNDSTHAISLTGFYQWLFVLLSKSARLLNAARLLEIRGESNAHGHDDVAVAVGLVGERAHLPGGLFVFQFDADGAIGRGTKKIQHVGGIETDGDGLAFEFFLDCFFGLAVLRARGGDF